MSVLPLVCQGCSTLSPLQRHSKQVFTAAQRPKVLKTEHQKKKKLKTIAVFNIINKYRSENRCKSFKAYLPSCILTFHLIFRLDYIQLCHCAEFKYRPKEIRKLASTQKCKWQYPLWGRESIYQLCANVQRKMKLEALIMGFHSTLMHFTFIIVFFFFFTVKWNCYYCLHKISLWDYLSKSLTQRHHLNIRWFHHTCFCVMYLKRRIYLGKLIFLKNEYQVQSKCF